MSFTLSPLYFTAVCIAQQCSSPGQPTHVGDPPGDGVITVGVILRVRDSAPNGQCGSANPYGFTTMEAMAWAVRNAQKFYHHAHHVKIGDSNTQSVVICTLWAALLCNGVRECPGRKAPPMKSHSFYFV